MEQFTYKPAWVLRRVQASVDARGVTLARGGKSRRMAFADVTGVRLVEIDGRTSSTSLVLLAGKDKLVLHCGARAADAAHDANTRAFVAACVAVLAALGKARPDVRVSFGGGVALRAFMAGLGVVSMLLGLFMGVLALAGGEPGEPVWYGLAAAAMLLGGGAMAWSFNPFRTPPTAPACEAAQDLAALALE